MVRPPFPCCRPHKLQQTTDHPTFRPADDTDLIMLCYSIDSKDSLENVESKWVGEIADNCPGVKLVLVALKCDLREQSDDENHNDEAAADGGATGAAADAGAEGGAGGAAASQEKR